MTEEEQIYHTVYGYASSAHDLRALTPEKRFRKNGKGEHTEIPYITHPVVVKDIAIQLADDYQPRAVFLISLISLLHDILEDTTVTEAELTEFLSSLLSFAETTRVVHCVKLLTKDENYEIVSYLSRIKMDFLARVVKLADLTHNMSDLKPGNMLDKYKLCYHILDWNK